MRLCLAASVLLLSAIVGCEEPGRVHVSDRQLVGNFVTEIANGKEHLTLKPDQTYIQSFSSSTRQFTTRGTWKSSDEFLSGTDIELTGAIVSFSEDNPSTYGSKHGVLNLQVHRENGKLRLARNEAADWYYERAQ